MAHTGPAAKAVKHGKTSTADWTEVVNAPYVGSSPELPKLGGRRQWKEQVSAWWAEVRAMPHCALWTATDWRFALETAYIKQQFWADLAEGKMQSTTATEIRRREDQMGTTGEARRKLRIRYVDPPGVSSGGGGPAGGAPVVDHQEVAGGPGTVTPIGSRRQRLTA